jgi:hypothetical protein
VNDAPARLEVEDLQYNLREVQALLQKQKMVEGLVEGEPMPRQDREAGA